MNCLSRHKKFKSKHPAWSDPSDEVTTEVKEDPVADDSEESSDDEIYAGDVRNNKASLDSKNLQYKHVCNINDQRSFKGPVRRVQFHPKSRIALVAIGHSQADLYEVDGERNRYVQNIKVPNTKSPFCSFHPNGESVVISSENYRGNFFTYDMVSSSINKFALRVGRENKPFTDFTMYQDYMACRKEGNREVLILSAKSFEIITTVTINEPVKAIQFTSENLLYIAGENARIYVWDMKKLSVCKHKFQDIGTVHVKSMSISKPSNQLSLGSDNGVVNIYQLDNCLANKFPEPIKSLHNLKTDVDILQYNHTGELLLMGSSVEPQAFRIIYSHSGSVYKNFPKPGKEYGHVLCSDFSPFGGYLALGSSKGRAHLCRIPYYTSY